MTEKEYINAKTLGTITAAIYSLKDLDPQILSHIIDPGESKQVFQTLHDWRYRLFNDIEITE